MTKAFPLVLVFLLSSSLATAQSPQNILGAPTPAPSDGVNLAVVAKPSSSYVSGDTSLQALNDGATPRRSNDNRTGSYGNWPQKGTQWVEYHWSQPISTSKVSVYWWADGAGVGLPKSWRLSYWDGKAFVPVGKPSGFGLEINDFNTTTFDEIRTDRLRLEMDSDGTLSTGILEWKVYDSGKSPKFPPNVSAGVDRVVILGGKTYLNPTIKALYADHAPALKWSKESGPGNVAFADAGASETTATFSAVGKYVLKLTASEGALTASSTLNAEVDAPPPLTQLDAVYTKTYKVNNALWNSRVKALIVNWIPHCIEKISDVNLREGGINNFIQAGNKLAGREFTRHVGYPFSNAWVHNTVESICVALMDDPQGDAEITKSQTAMRAKLEEWIPIILAAQEPDGYLQTRFTLDTRGARHWDPRTRGEHEGYVAGYFIESALAHYLLTDGKDLRLYNAAKKLADCWYNNIGPAPRKTWFDGHQEMEQALVRLGRFVNAHEGAGKGQKYIELAKFLLDCRQGGREYDQSHLPIFQQYEAVGHAVRAAYTYSGMADVAVETHDVDYQSAVKSLWDNIVDKKYYITGGIGSGETSEGFGPNYSLRNNAYCESCSNCGLLFFQYKMNLAYQDSKYADLMEDTIYNAILGDIDLEGNNFYYQNPLEGGAGRYAWHNCPCCVGNISRVLLSLPTWMYAKSADSIYVNLFIGSTATVENVAGTNVEMVQATEYPWNNKVAITVNPAAPAKFTIKVRVPMRNVSTLYSAAPNSDGLVSLAVNGADMAPVLDKGYAVITRNWKAGDRIELVLPMKPQRIKASALVAADRGRVALRYGPLIYNIESAEQKVDSVLPSTSALSTQWRPDFLAGVMVIHGTFADGSPMTAIPNYARNNRSPATAAPVSGNARGNQANAPRSLVWMRDE